MANFFKDYKDMVIVPQVDFIKKHWVGYTTILVVSGVVGYVIPEIMYNKSKKQFSNELNKLIEQSHKE